MKKRSMLGALVAGLVLSANAAAQEPSNLGPAVIGASQTSIFGETEAERRRNRALAIAAGVAVIVIGVNVLDDDNDAPPIITPPIHHAGHHGG